MDKQELFNTILYTADDRLMSGEDPDPLTALADRIRNGEEVSFELAAFILKAHLEGPWAINSQQEYAWFQQLCNECGSPLATVIDIVEVKGIRVYLNDLGDCCLMEAAFGSKFAVWINKNRLYIGFKYPETAVKFRSLNEDYSMKKTRNRNLGMVVLEGWGEWETSRNRIEQVCEDLTTLN